MMNEDTSTDYLFGIKEFALTDRDNNMCHKRYRVHWLISEVERLRRQAEFHSEERKTNKEIAEKLVYWLDNNFTFCNPGEVPVLGEVSRRIWYHATDDIESFPFSEIMGKAIEKKE